MCITIIMSPDRKGNSVVIFLKTTLSCFYRTFHVTFSPFLTNFTSVKYLYNVIKLYEVIIINFYVSVYYICDCYNNNYYNYAKRNNSAH